MPSARQLTRRRLLAGGALAGSGAIALVGLGGYSYVQQGEAVDDAVTVQATVDSARVERIDSRRSIDYEPDIEYTYRYRGETYTSDQVFPGPTIRTYSDRSKAESVVRSYEPGTTVRAYVRPSAPGDAYLIRERTPWPARAFAIGGVLLCIVVLAGLGPKHPGQHELRPEREVRSPPSRTWVERNDGTLRRLSKWALLVCFVAFWFSMVGLAFGILSLAEGSARPVEADLIGPVGVPLLAAFGFWVGMILSLCLYGVQSFSRYRRLRRRLPSRHRRVRSDIRVGSSRYSGRRATSYQSTDAVFACWVGVSDRHRDDRHSRATPLYGEVRWTGVVFSHGFGPDRTAIRTAGDHRFRTAGERRSPKGARTRAARVATRRRQPMPSSTVRRTRRAPTARRSPRTVRLRNRPCLHGR
jgi:hypothetical protein